MGYPDEITNFDFDLDIGICSNGILFDIDRGLLLKMAEGQEIIHAVKGRKVLSQIEIELIYGSPPIYQNYQWPNTSKL